MKKWNSGFSLLEIIIVLVLIGFLLIGLARFKQKQLKQITRQHVATAVVQEMYGMLKFVNEDELAMSDSKDLQINPLYTKDKSDVDVFRNVYYKRVKNTGLLDSLQNFDYLTWSGSNSQRIYFTNESCDGNGIDPTGGKVDRHFELDYILCKLPDIAAAGSMQLDRIDLVGSASDTLAIDRLDFIVKFVPDVKTDYLLFESFKQEFDTALAYYKFGYTQATILRRQVGGTAKDWKQILTGTDKNISAISFGSVSSYMDEFTSPQSYEYAIRFSFETGIGKYAKADGSIGVDKLCWNIEKSMTGPCIKATDTNHLAIYNDKKSDSKPGLCWDLGAGKSLPCLSVSEGTTQGVNGDDQTMHLTVEKDKKIVTGTLMANVIFENTANINKENGFPELLTIPIVEYRNFGNDFTDAKTDIPYERSVSDEPGTMTVNVQQCPTAPGGRKLYPRLVASISSVAADVGLDATGKKSETDYTDLSANRANLGAVGRLGGVALQVNFDKTANKWIVSTTSAVYDNITGEGINLINSKGVSAVLTAWCSTTEQ